MRRLVCENRSAWPYFGLGEADAFSLAPEYISQRPTIALTQCNDTAARIFPMSLEAPIDAIGSRVGGANMAAKIRSVDLHSPIEPDTLCLASSASRSYGPERRPFYRTGQCIARAVEPTHPLQH